MNKIDLTVRLSLSVLTAGLVSCAKDEKARDVFRAPPPVINNKGSQDLKTWDRRSDKSLDLQDSFDVSAGQPLKLQVTSRCRLDQRSYIEEFSLNPHAPIKIFQVLPTDLLTADLKNLKYDCGFELVLINGVGSRHIYQIPTVPILDEQRTGIKIERAGHDEQVERISTRMLESLRARFDDQGEAEILCTDVKLTKLPFTRVIDLGSFDFSKPKLKADRPEFILQDRPLQACRILLRKNEALKQVSDRILIQFPQNPLLVQQAPVENPSDSQKMIFFKGAPLPVAQVLISNPDKMGKRKIILEGQPSSMTLETYTFNGFRYVIKEAFLMSSPSGTIEIPAGRHVIIAFRLQPTRASRFFHVHASDTLTVSGAVPFTEIDEGGQVLDKGEVSLPRTNLPGLLVPNDTEFKAIPSEW